MSQRVMRAGWRVCAILPVALLLGGVVWGLGHWDRDGREGCTDPSKKICQLGAAQSSGVPEKEAVGGPLLAHFAILAKPPSGLPPQVQKSLGPPPFGVEWSSARPLPTGLSRRVWVIPGVQHLCLLEWTLENGLASTCTRTAIALRQGVSATTIKEAMGSNPAVRDTVGVVPDRAQQVRIITPGYPAKRVRVTDNLFGFSDHIPEPPERIEIVL